MPFYVFKNYNSDNIIQHRIKICNIGTRDVSDHLERYIWRPNTSILNDSDTEAD